MKHPDLSIPTSIIISGVESDRYWNIVVDQCEMKTVLMSYHYLQDKPSGFLGKRLSKYETTDHVTKDGDTIKKSKVKVFIDSGAHTFFQKFDEYKKMDDKFWDDYLTKYTNWVRENKEYIFACANLDIDAIVGTDKVDEWNAKYFQPLEDEGVQVCYIWHTERGHSGWEDYCKKHSYIGLTMENDTLTIQQLMRLINVSKKYNTRVHGMALTRMEVLVRVPFFSVDSTTWLVGQQYGELNWFNGRKMQRLSKIEWQRQYKTKLLKEPFNADWEKLMTGMGGKGDTYELLRLNVLAYKLAEEHVRKRLKTKMYWLPNGQKGDDKEVELRRLEDIELPDRDWYNEGEQEGWESYLEQLGIEPTNFTEEEAVNILYFFYMFIEDDTEALDEIEDETLISYANQVSNGSMDNREDALNVLKDYYLQNATGERTDFIIEEAESNAPKERAKYIEEEAFTIVDLSEAEVVNSTSHLLALPSGDDMPEISAYDDELKRHGITAVRDENGKFLKGQQKVRKPRNMYSQLYPKLNCDTCYKSGDCPQYQAGFVCAFDKMFKRFDTRNLDDVIESMQGMASFNMERLQRAMIFETLDGGMPTAEVTGLIDQNMRLMEKMKDLVSNSPKAVLEQRRVIKSDGSEETTTTMNVNPTQGGVLSQIFMSDVKKKDKEDIIDVE